MDRVLSYIVDLRRSPSLSFIPLPPIQPPPLRGTSFHRKEGMATRAPSLGRGCRAQRGGVGFLLGRRSGALVNDALETIFPTLFHTARTLSGSLRSPPSPRGEGFVSRKAVFSFRSLPHWGRGTASAVNRVLSYIVDLRRISPLFFIPLVPYPARSVRHLPHAGKALFVGIVFPHMRVFALTMREKRCSHFAAFPIGEGGPRSGG